LNYDALNASLEKVVINQAESDFERMIEESKTKLSVRPDHVHTSSFAYALEHDVFTKRQLRRIPFDYGETPETYIETYGKPELITTLRNILLHPKGYSFSEVEDMIQKGVTLD
jgi:hypothetical protein